MKILVANLGSTSFKYRLFDMADEKCVARGGVERIGSAESPCFVEIGGKRTELKAQVPDHAVAVKQCLAQLTDPATGCLKNASEVAAIGFKAVHGGRVSGVQRVTDNVLAAMEEMNLVAPAHNPPYIKTMRLLAEKLPEIPLVAAFETDFHSTIDDRLRYYPAPFEWAEKLHIKRWGFHGASHRYIAQRTSQMLGRYDLRIISCHLGGSNSLCAIRGQQSVATSMGMSPQTGLPHNNRVGDLDAFAVPFVMRTLGLSLDEVERQLCKESGLKGISAVSNDIRDIQSAAAQGNAKAQLALDVFVQSARHWIGAYLAELNGADALSGVAGVS